MLTTVKHEIAPVYDENCRVLILGTMPSPKSREAGFYYGHPQNRFWKVLAALWDEPVPETIPEKKCFLLKHHIALWDVLASCDIHGADDSSIKNPVPNDFSVLLKEAPIEAIFTTGKKAYETYCRLCEKNTGIKAMPLPSTSPANCRMKWEDILMQYQAILKYLDEKQPNGCDEK